MIRTTNFHYMRIIWFTAVLLFLASGTHGAEIKVDTTIQTVTVFPRGAKIVRVANIILPKGKNTLIFEGVSNSLVEDSVDIKVGSESLIVIKSFESDLKKIGIPTGDKKYGLLEEGYKLRKDIRLNIDVHKKESAKIIISYQITKANWQKGYDAHLDTGANKIALKEQYIVSQKSGVDWHDVNIMLSNNVVSNKQYFTNSGRRPFAHQANSPTLAHVKAGNDAPQNNVQKNLLEVKKVSILTGNKAYKHLINEVSFKAHFVKDKSVKVGKVEIFDVIGKYKGEKLIAGGSVNLYMDGQYAGTSQLGNIQPGAEVKLKFSMGILN